MKFKDDNGNAHSGSKMLKQLVGEEHLGQGLYPAWKWAIINWLSLANRKEFSLPVRSGCVTIHPVCLYAKEEHRYAEFYVE